MFWLDRSLHHRIEQGRGRSAAGPCAVRECIGHGGEASRRISREPPMTHQPHQVHTFDEGEATAAGKGVQRSNRGAGPRTRIRNGNAAVPKAQGTHTRTSGSSTRARTNAPTRPDPSPHTTRTHTLYHTPPHPVPSCPALSPRTTRTHACTYHTPHRATPHRPTRTHTRIHARAHAHAHAHTHARAHARMAV